MDLNHIYSISTVIREMQVKATKKQHFILARMVLIKKNREITVVGGDGEIGILIYTTGGSIKVCSYFGKQSGSSSKI